MSCKIVRYFLHSDYVCVRACSDFRVCFFFGTDLLQNTGVLLPDFFVHATHFERVRCAAYSAFIICNIVHPSSRFLFLHYIEPSVFMHVFGYPPCFCFLWPSIVLMWCVQLHCMQSACGVGNHVLLSCCFLSSAFGDAAQKFETLFSVGSQCSIIWGYLACQLIYPNQWNAWQFNFLDSMAR